MIDLPIVFWNRKNFSLLLSGYHSNSFKRWPYPEQDILFCVEESSNIEMVYRYFGIKLNYLKTNDSHHCGGKREIHRTNKAECKENRNLELIRMDLDTGAGLNHNGQ